MSAADSFKGPKPLPSRKAQVHRGARERIVETDRRLNHELDAHRHTKRREDAERRRGDMMADIINGPLEEEVRDSLMRQAGAALADMIMADLKTNHLPNMMPHLYLEAYLCLRDETDHMGRALADALLKAGKSRFSVFEEFTSENGPEVQTVSSFRFQPTDVHFAHAYARTPRGLLP